MLILFPYGNDEIELSSRPYADIINKQQTEKQRDGRLRWILGHECRKRGQSPRRLQLFHISTLLKIRAVTVMCTAEGSYSTKWVMHAEKHESLGHETHLISGGRSTQLIYLKSIHTTL